MAEKNGKSGNPAKNTEKTTNEPTTYVLYKLQDNKNLEFVATSVGVTREAAVQAAVEKDSKLAGVPLTPVAQSRLVRLAGAAKTTVKVSSVA